LPWSYGSWIYNYLCNQCLLPLMLWVRISIRARCTTLCDKVCEWLATGQWFSPGTPVSSTNNTDRHNITEILLKEALQCWDKPKTFPIQFDLIRINGFWIGFFFIKISLICTISIYRLTAKFNRKPGTHGHAAPLYIWAHFIKYGVLVKKRHFYF